MAATIRLDSNPNPATKWIVVGTLFFVALINYADRTAITAVYSVLKTDLGFTDVGLGVIGSLFLWSYAVASPIAGYIGDRVDRRSVVLWSLCAWSLVTLLTGLVTSRWQLLTLRVFLGLAESFYLPAAMALIAEHHPRRSLATAQGTHTVGLNVGLVFGGTLAGYLGQHHGWRSPFITLGLLGGVLAVASYFLLPTKPHAAAGMARERPAPHLSFFEASRRLCKIPSFLIIGTAGVLTAIGTWIFINWLPLYFKEVFGMTLAGAGFAGSSLPSLSAAASHVFGGMVSDAAARRGPQRRMLMQAVLILLAAPVLLAFIFTHNFTLIVAALVLYNILRSCADLNMIPMLCELAGKDKLSTAFGITNMLNNAAGGMGVILAGFLKADFGLAGVFAGVAGILVIDSVLLTAGYVMFLKRDLEKAAEVPAVYPA